MPTISRHLTSKITAFQPTKHVTRVTPTTCFTEVYAPNGGACVMYTCSILANYRRRQTFVCTRLTTTANVCIVISERAPLRDRPPTQSFAKISYRITFL